jgi:Zn-dependent protease with chaperone function
MSAVVLVGLVVLATFGLASAALSGLLALVWRLTVRRRATASLDLLSLRLLPAVGAALVALAVVLPAFLSYEPPREDEAAGPWLWVFAGFAAVCLAHGIWRGARACSAARTLLGRCGPAAPGDWPDGHLLHLPEAGEPLAAVIGAWRPRVVVTESVRAACSPEEFSEVLAHEAAHLASGDNLKLLLLTSAPDALAWTPLATELLEQWRNAAEREADQRATGADRERRLALASALIKVARLQQGPGEPRAALGMPVAADDVAGRVRGLLAPPAGAVRPAIALALALSALLLPLIAVPSYALLHELIERLVALGR